MATTLPNAINSNSTAHTSNAPHGADLRSPWFDMDAGQVWNRYSAQTRAIRIAHCGVIIVLAIGALGMLFLGRPWGVWPALALILVGGICVIMSNRRRLGRRFDTLVTILLQDCDVSKYRTLLTQVQRHDTLGKDAKRLGIERARCDYYDDDPRKAIDELTSLNITTTDARNLRIMAANIAANVYHALGLVSQCADQVAELRRLASDAKVGSSERAALDGVLADMAVLFVPATAWNEETSAYIVNRLSNERTHCGRCTWQLALAEYEALQGNLSKARALLDDPGLKPMTPRSEHESERINRLLVERRGR